MKNVTLILYIVCFTIKLSRAQDIQSLRVPSTPAFSILNFEPTSILKPSSMKDLGGDIVNSFDENGKLKMNLGMEFMPYWLKSRPYLTYEKYSHPTTGQRILQTMNISAATVRDTANNKNKFGMGLRFQLVNGETNSEYEEKHVFLVQRLTFQSVAPAGRTMVKQHFIKSKKEAKDFVKGELDNPEYGLDSEDVTIIGELFDEITKNKSDTEADLTSAFEDFNTKLNDKNSILLTKVYELSKQRTGFFLEIAGAAGFSETGNKSSLERAGVWVSTSYLYKKGDAWHVNARYQFSSRDTSLDNFDVGFAYSKELTRFSLSMEGMMRWYRAVIPDRNINNQPILRLEKDFTYRLALQSCYLISDGISINISIGKDFSSPYYNREGIFSIFGLNYTLFRKVEVPVKK